MDEQVAQNQCRPFSEGLCDGHCSLLDRSQQSRHGVESELGGSLDIEYLGSLPRQTRTRLGIAPTAGLHQSLHYLGRLPKTFPHLDPHRGPECEPKQTKPCQIDCEPGPESDIEHDSEPGFGPESGFRLEPGFGSGENSERGNQEGIRLQEDEYRPSAQPAIDIYEHGYIKTKRMNEGQKKKKWREKGEMPNEIARETVAYLGRCRWNPDAGGWVERAALNTILTALLQVAATGCILSIAVRRTAVRGVGGKLTILSICRRRRMSRRQHRFNEGRFAKAYALNSSRATRSHPDSVGLLKNQQSTRKLCCKSRKQLFRMGIRRE